MEENSDNKSKFFQEAINQLLYVHRIFYNNNSEDINNFFQNDIDFIKRQINIPVHKDEAIVIHDDHYKGYTPIHFAIQNSNVEVVKTLLDFGANINISSGKGSPIQCAVIADNKEIYYELLNRGSDVNIVNFSGYNAYQTLFTCDFNERFNLNDDILEFWFERLYEAGCYINHINNNGDTALHVTPWDLVELLINHGADINIVNKNGNTPLYSFHVIEDLDYPEIYFEVYKCIKKLQALNLYVHEKNIQICSFMLKNRNEIDEDGKFFNDDNVKNFEAQLLNESARMKAVKISNSATLYNLLTLNDLTFYSENETLNKVFNSPDFINYELYGTMLHIKFKRGIERRQISKLILPILDYISQNTFTTLILEKIFSYLSLANCRHLLGKSLY